MIQSYFCTICSMSLNCLTRWNVNISVSIDQAEGNDWHAMNHLRNKRQKQSVSVNRAAVRLCAALAPADFLIWEALVGSLLWSECFPLFLERLEFHSCCIGTNRAGTPAKVWYEPYRVRGLTMGQILAILLSIFSEAGLGVVCQKSVLKWE